MDNYNLAQDKVFVYPGSSKYKFVCFFKHYPLFLYFDLLIYLL